MKFFNFKLALQLIVCLLVSHTAFGQEVKSVNGRLSFSTEAAYLNLYNQLSAEVDRTPEPGGEADIPAGQYYDPYPSLAAFESAMGIQSIRQADLLSEYDQLRRGAEPENVVRSWVIDPVAAAMMSRDFMIQIGDEVFYMPNEKVSYKVRSANEAILRDVMAGGDVGRYGDLIIKTVRTVDGPLGPLGPTGPEGGCDGFEAGFKYPISLLTSNSGQFTFNGTVSGTDIKYTWNFGDGTPTSNQQNPVHTFPAQGIYNVCVEVTNKEGCYDSYCFLVAVNQGCIAKFKDHKGGAVGVICFENESTATSGIVSYKWNFGDGGTSTEANPCHTYGCDGEYTVTLEIVSASGCKRSVDHKVQVSSYNCCDDDIDENETKFTITYDGNKKLVGHANTWHPWIGSDNANAELTNYKKSVGIWWRSKTNLRVEIRGNMYGDSQLGCACIEPFDIGCEDSGNNTSHVKAKKVLPANDEYKTRKDNPWRALYFKGGAFQKEVIVPTNCD